MNRQIRRLLPRLLPTAILCGALLWHAPAQANIGEMYGFGARSPSLGGAVVSWGFDGYAAYSNPAGLGWAFETAEGHAPERLGISFSIQSMAPTFKPIENVTVTNDIASSTPAPTTGNVDTNYRSAFGQALGLVYRFTDDTRLSMGLTTYLPLEVVDFFDTGDAYAPEYLMYRARPLRPQIEVAMGYTPWKFVSMGAGIHFGFGQTANATALLNTATGPSSLRLTNTIKAKASPYFGLLFTPFGDGRLTFGSVLRLPLASDSIMVMNAASKVLGTVLLDFKFSGSSALYYDPLTVELGTSAQILPDWRVYAQADFQNWTKYTPPAFKVENIPGGVDINPSRNPGFTTVNTWTPRIGQEYTRDRTTLRAGWAYRPSILSEIPNGAGNPLDPAKHMFNLGLGRKFGKFLHFDVPCTVDLNLAWHWLLPQEISKTPGDENGNLASSKIGAPGYSAGGKVFGGAVSLNLHL